MPAVWIHQRGFVAFKLSGTCLWYHAPATKGEVSWMARKTCIAHQGHRQGCLGGSAFHFNDIHGYMVHINQYAASSAPLLSSFLGSCSYSTLHIGW